MSTPKFESVSLRKLADYSQGERLTRFHTETGDKYLVNAETMEPEAWPLLGVQAQDDLPRFTRLPTSTVRLGVAEGWIELEGQQQVFRPGGPPEDPWRVTHTFTHVEAVTFKLVNGDVRYEPHGKRAQPDKYNPDGSVCEIAGDPDAEVEWFYTLKAVKGVLSRGGDVEAADFVFNIAKGRGTQWVEEIRASVAPYANSALILSLWRRGASTDAALKDYDTVALLEADANAAELVSGVNANYVRKVLIDTTPTIVYDDTNEWVDIDFADQTWVALGAGGTAITDLLTAFDNDTTAGTDANIVPWLFQAFAVTPDGSDVTAVLPTGGTFRAS